MNDSNTAIEQIFGDLGQLSDYDISFIRRLLSKSDIDANDCFVYGGTVCYGFGELSYNNVGRVIHRMAYSLLTKVPYMLTKRNLDKCPNQLCWNPLHNFRKDEWGIAKLFGDLTGKSEEDIERMHRIHDNTRQVGDCLLWTGGRNKKGYGVCALGEQSSGLSHKLAYSLYHAIPYKEIQELICHACRNRHCVAKDHLSEQIGTSNYHDDMERDGTKRKGEKHYRSTISDTLRDEIKASYRPKGHPEYLTQEIRAAILGTTKSIINHSDDKMRHGDDQWRTRRRRIATKVREKKKTSK